MQRSNPNRVFQIFSLMFTVLSLMFTSISHADVGKPEKAQLKFGFIKLTDMAPLAVA